MADEPVAPIDSVEHDHAARSARPVELSAPAPAIAQPAPAAAPTGPPSVTRPGGEALGDAAAHELIEHPAQSPAGVVRRATIHDAAEHGNRMAQAIEDTQRSEPTDRARQLGGAAAVAGSGQASPRATGPRDTDEHDDVAAPDPLAAVTRVGDDERGDEQRRHDRRALGEERLDTEADAGERR